MEHTVINYLFDKGETVSEGICFTSQSKVTGLLALARSVGILAISPLQCFIFLFEEVSCSSRCLGKVALFYCDTPCAFHITILEYSKCR